MSPPTVLAEPALGDLDFSAPRAALYAALSRHLPRRDEYLRVARTLTRRYAFVIPLLPVHAARTTALIFESRLGSVTASLAAYFHSILCVPATPLDRACIERRIRQTRIQNVTVLAADGPLDAAAVELGVVLLTGYSYPAMLREIDAEAPTMRMFMRLAEQRLSTQGILVVADNNGCNYRKWKSMTGLADCVASAGRRLPPAVDRLVSAQRLRERLYFAGRNPLSPEFWPPPEYIGGSEASAAYPRGGNLVKDRIVRARWFRRFWPAFLFLGARQEYPTNLDALLTESGVAERAGWAPHERIRIRKLVVGNVDTTVIIAGPEDRHDADVVVRLPDSDEGRVRCETNAKTLDILAHGSLAHRVPRLLAAGTWRDRMYSVESRCAGREAMHGGRKTQAAIRKACAALLEFHAQICVRQPVTARNYQGVVDSALAAVRRYSDARTHERIDTLNRRIQLALVDSAMAIGCTHGDFKLGNLLFDRHGEVRAIIDWDHAQSQGWPLLDYLTCLNYQLAREWGQSPSQVYLRQILPWRLPSASAGMIEQAVERLGLTATQFLALRIVLWLVIVRDRFDPCLLAHTEWRREILGQTLDHMERQSRRLE